MTETLDPRGPSTPPKAKKPQDHKPKKKAAGQVNEATDRAVTFTYDGDEWTVKASDVTSLEFFAALADAEDDDDPLQFVRAMRIMLGKEQAARLFKGRDFSIVRGFFVAANEAVDAGNR